MLEVGEDFLDLPFLPVDSGSVWQVLPPVPSVVLDPDVSGLPPDDS